MRIGSCCRRVGEGQNYPFLQFVLTANIGSANFNYDMRRLAELISFPKPWYRHTIAQRLFFGGHSVKTPTYTETSFVMNHASSKPLSNKSASSVI